tara:strand:+ start:41046 stop:41255 length:210 start_codon:yes stop_codon:yes gene_type:complete
MEEYIREKVIRYCEQNEGVTLHTVYKAFEKDLWNMIAMMHGEWIASQSDFEGIEFSEGNFDMVEYKIGD